MNKLIETLDKVFKGKHTGTYLDIGSYDGVTDNATNFFYQHGWRGVCIEPQAKYHKLGIENRPDDHWIKGVVVEREHEGKTVTFYETEDGKRSSTVGRDYDIEEVPTEKKKQLKAIKINDALPHDTFPNGLDLLVINTGEDDLEIIVGIDLGLLKPNIVAVPSLYTSDMFFPEHMQVMGYYHLAHDKTGDWLVFSNDYEDMNAL